MPGIARTMSTEVVEEIYITHGRRRSADLGGLLLATVNPMQGKGWLGYGYNDDLHTRYAELLSDMFEQTYIAVNEHNVDSTPVRLSRATRYRLIDTLQSWHFEPHKLPEDEAVACTILLFEALYRIHGMERTIGVSLSQISSFIQHLRRIYRLENSYHNFQHALDVLQAVYCYLRSAGMVPPVSILKNDDRMWRPDKTWDGGPIVTSLGLVELFAVYVAAIGHDVGHPGLTNVFMKNARAPLSLVFDNKSALEHLHYQLLLRVMRQHGMGSFLDNPHHGCRAKKLLRATVLATDMSSRPYDVSKHWASALADEWLSQTLLEKQYELPCTLSPASERISQAKNQIFFISNFAKPLLDLTAKAIPEIRPYADQCLDNLNRWKTVAHELQQSSSPAIYPPVPPPPHSPKPPGDYSNAFPLTLPPLPPATIWPSFSTRSGPPSTACSFASSSSSNTSSTSASLSSDSGVGSNKLNIDDVPSGPSSPTDSVASSSFLFSPHSEISSTANHSHRPPSSCGSASGGAVGGTADPSSTSAIFRAVSQVAKRKKPCENRNSWSPNIPFHK
ncbi:hypothetical protein ONZ45_g7860 [Pleurotus djamor]|nr:hypothetical protein ONZ45_g7860 [Pleurotus djamor]